MEFRAHTRSFCNFRFGKKMMNFQNLFSSSEIRGSNPGRTEIPFYDANFLNSSRVKWRYFKPILGLDG